MPIIHLSDTDTQAFDENHLIQQGAKVKFEKLVQGFIKSLSDKANDEDRWSHSFRTETARVHNTILINGKRGMGKTSFILSILDQKNRKDKKTSWHDEVCNLRIIDPTMIESKEHIFLNIIVRIKKKVEEYRNSNCHKSDKCFQQWEDSLKKLSGGLCVLDGVGSDPLKNDLWDSPELILEKGLVNSKQGSELEQNFHSFLDESLAFLEKKVFLLVLDDIDTSLKEGKAILEILRKYLTSKKLIIVMLGDIDLYATIVRQLQWEKMDPRGTLLGYEKDGSKIKEFYRSQIEHLEEQYLTKLLKPQNRIKLQTIQELKKDLKVQCDEEDEQLLTDVVGRLVETVFLTKPRSQYAKLYEQTLLAQSTRSVVQVLRGSRDSGIICSNQNTENKPVLNAFIEVLRQLFFTTLKKNLEPFDLLFTTKERSLLNRVAVYMLKQAISRDSHMKLLPEYRDDEKNITMLFLNAEINAQLKPQHYLSYLIKVGYAIDRFGAVGAVGDADYTDKFIDHIGLDSEISNAHMSRRLMATFNGKKGVFFGNLFLSSTDYRKIDNQKKLVFFMSRVFSQKHGHYSYLSLFNFLGVLADISLLVDNSADEDSQRLLEVERKRVLNDCNLIRDFHVYDSRLEPGSEHDNAEELDYITKKEFDYDELTKYFDDLSAWSKTVSDVNQVLSAADLANIWIRLSYTLNGIDSNQKNKLKNYLQRIELYIAAFFNAVYICCEEKKGNSPDIKNPSTDPDYFYNKLNGYDKGDDFTFFDYLYGCRFLSREFIASINELESISSSSNRSAKTNRKKADNRKQTDFQNMPIKEQIKAIMSTSNWQTNKPTTVRRNLYKTLKYSSLPSDAFISDLIKEAKAQVGSGL